MSLWRKPKSDEELKGDLIKLDNVLECLKGNELRLDYFLFLLFVYKDCNDKKIQRSARHRQMVVAIINGSHEYTITDVVEAMYSTATAYKYRHDDNTMPGFAATFSPTQRTRDIRHAQPGLLSWAVWSTTRLIQGEAETLTAFEAGLHVRGTTRKIAKDHDLQRPHTAASISAVETQPAMVREGRGSGAQSVDAAERAEGASSGGGGSTHPGVQGGGGVTSTKRRGGAEERQSKGPLISWDILSKFSFQSLQLKFKQDAPVMWHLVNAYTNSSVQEGQTPVVRSRRPQTLVSTENNVREKMHSRRQLLG
ncbi:hypothetical protein PsYK624_045110 [Phanerochaete sordida]|uniref:Uncharacterized protein n=1 Tax=Phanerochaete sordida TaxID=48140 RepID=A0A9P3G3H6_9APHY|nr:hypothetical protein PsYK624_045110 [Phanerochaete sordida]